MSSISSNSSSSRSNSPAPQRRKAAERPANSSKTRDRSVSRSQSASPKRKHAQSRSRSPKKKDSRDANSDRDKGKSIYTGDLTSTLRHPKYSRGRDEFEPRDRGDDKRSHKYRSGSPFASRRTPPPPRRAGSSDRHRHSPHRHDSGRGYFRGRGRRPYIPGYRGRGHRGGYNQRENYDRQNQSKVRQRYSSPRSRDRESPEDSRSRGSLRGAAMDTPNMSRHPERKSDDRWYLQREEELLNMQGEAYLRKQRKKDRASSQDRNPQERGVESPDTRADRSSLRKHRSSASPHYTQDMDYRTQEQSREEPIAVSRDSKVSSANGNSKLSELEPQRNALSKRFSEINGLRIDKPDFEPEENIMIDIHRKFPNARDEDENLPVIFAVDVERFLFPRRPGEGEKPIFDRPEILSRRYDEEEHSARVIRVGNKSGKEELDRSSSKKRKHSKTSEGTKIKMADFHVVRREQERVRQAKDEPRATREESVDHETKKKSKLQKTRHRHDSSSDEWQEVSKSAIAAKGDLRNNLIKKRRADEKSAEQPETAGSRKVQRRDRTPGSDEGVRLEEVLPDFKLRPDREQIDSWDPDPTKIPRGTYYYEHDNRDTFVRGSRPYRSRGFRSRPGYQRGSYDNYRGRGYSRGFVPRGRSRGYVPGGYRDGEEQRRRSPRAWKHDKFLSDDLEERA